MAECKGCGTCCRIFSINLTEEEYLSGKYKTRLEGFGVERDFSKASERGLNVIVSKSDGSCWYLEGNRCGIWEERPKYCREFFCDSKEERFKGMIEEIREKKRGEEEGK